MQLFNFFLNFRSIKPFVNEEEFEESEKIAKKFVESGGEGEKLQKLLQQKAATSDNWVRE